MKRIGLLTISVVVAVALAACSLLPGSSNSTPFDVCSAASVVGGEQAAISGAVTITTQLHNAKKISDANYAQAKLAYSGVVAANQLLLQGLITINDAGGNASAITPQQYAQLLAALLSASAKFYAVYSAFTNQAGAMANARFKMREGATAAGTCTLTDAQLTAELTMPAWDN